MIEKWMTCIIHEFGPTGLLIVGLYFLFYAGLKKIAGHIETLNHNSTKLVEKFDTAVDRICDKLDGKN
ncbi:MAG: hypothetical protein WC433_07020 [Candidatus Omnitrophota bacterium]|jgi:hypothetical protein